MIVCSTMLPEASVALARKDTWPVAGFRRNSTPPAGVLTSLGVL
ncbi:hypothetical protein SAMN05444920_103743 [Nonomuraea solani]|uniref:Uncharacterized protein n=1 Tax=Nonomuraea solani TaxID=1144553 RepID=A0A1H6BY08_9ACTN|nr:hypothetical protein SAMN05444920_103743 [Nonomuraea solani]